MSSPRERGGTTNQQDDPATAAEVIHRTRPVASSRDLIAHLRTFADEAPVGIVMTTGKQHLVRYVNPTFRRLTGMEDHLLVGRPLADVLPSFGDERICLLLQTLLQIDTADLGMVVSSREGLMMTTWPLREGMPGEDSSGRIIQLQEDTESLVAREQRAREHALGDELRAVNQRLIIAALREEELAVHAQTANEAKSAFLATMSHELRTPLNAIIGYTCLLDEGIYGPVQLEQHQHLARINTSAKHLLSLIDDVLTHTRIDAGRETLHWTEIRSKQILDEAAILTMPLAVAKGLTLTVRPPAQPVVFLSDAGKIVQILINLLGNAIKFTNCGDVELAMSVDAGWAYFTVRDTGIGIPVSSLEHVFDAFWQVDQGPSRRVGGTGLGLSVSRGLAQLLGGSLTVQSTLGEGSLFTLRLPLQDPHAKLASSV